MFVVGLDLGTQSLKAVVCDHGLVVRGRYAVSYPTNQIDLDHVEQDPRAWEAALAPAIAGALAAAGVQADDVRALAIAGQLDGCIPVDNGGHATHPALIWQDRRAVTEATRIAANRMFALTGQVADASHMAPKIQWLRSHGIPAARFHQPVSYLVERLTGEAVIDPALASTTMLFDLTTMRWSPELLTSYELAHHQLPVVRLASSVAGTLTRAGAALTGLRAGTQVAVGTGDDFANPLGAGIAHAGPVMCSIGTAEVVGTVSAHGVLDKVGPEPMVETHAFPSGGFFIENPGWLSGGAIRWAVRLLGLAGDRQLDALAETAPPGAAGVTFIPSLAGAMTPVWRPHARAGFHGLTAAHDRPHIARAVLEGLAFACRDVVERLAALGLPTDTVVLSGGGARSRVWAQLRADALGRVHRVATEPDSCPLGAAMIALVAAGGFPDLVAAASLVPTPVTAFTPATTMELESAYQRYQVVGAHLSPLASPPGSQ
ncbi:MAG: FGGY-family carbohydrate kinase [Kofleriaceae bacterium]